MITLQAGPQLVLRPLGMRDTAVLFRLTDGSRARLRRWLSFVDGTTTPHHSAEFIRAALAQSRAGTGLHFGLWWRGALAGVLGYRRPDPYPTYQFGYWLGDGFEGQGLMTAACRALAGYAFAAAGAHRLEIRAALGNRRSRAIPERLGFRLEGVLREAELLAEGWVDHCVYGVTAGEWGRLRGLRASDPVQAAATPHWSAEPAPQAAAEDEAIDAEMAEYYEARAPEYDDWYERRGRYADPLGAAVWFQELARLGAVVARFGEGLADGAAVLDVGCGTGRWTAALAERETVGVVGLDQAPGMLRQAQERCGRLGLRPVLVQGDALRLPFPDDAFDAAISAFVFDHLAASRRAAFLAELRRVVRRGGRVLIVDSRREQRHIADMEIQHRILEDGRRFRVRKSLFTADTLRQALAPLGTAAAGETATFFVWAEVRLQGAS